MNDENMEVVQDDVLSETGSTGADVSAEADTVLDYQETVIVEDRAFYTTPFSSDYTVTEGLLLLIFVILVVDFFLNLLRRWF